MFCLTRVQHKRAHLYIKLSKWCEISEQEIVVLLFRMRLLLTSVKMLHWFFFHLLASCNNDVYFSRVDRILTTAIKASNETLLCAESETEIDQNRVADFRPLTGSLVNHI